VFCCCIHGGYWLSSIIDFARFVPLAETKNVVLTTTKLTLSPKEALGTDEKWIKLKGLLFLLLGLLSAACLFYEHPKLTLQRSNVSGL
jgi:hypothetical protein